jgi:hypothetical protein
MHVKSDEEQTLRVSQETKKYPYNSKPNEHTLSANAYNALHFEA